MQARREPRITTHRNAERVCQNPDCGRLFVPGEGSYGKFCDLQCAAAYKAMLSTGEGIVRIIEPVAPDLVDRTVFDGPKILTADWHLPNLHARMWERLLEVRKATGISELVIAGDWMDNRAFSPHPGDHGISHLPAHELATTVMDELCKRFKRVILAPGNHDWWLAEFFKGTLEYDDIIRILFQKFIDAGVLRIVPVPYVHMSDCGEEFVIVHQKTFSGVNPQGVAVGLESNRLEYRDKHVITTHGHLEAIGRSGPGHRLAGQLGCMTDPKRTNYIQKYTTRHREWNPGFGVVSNGWFWTVNNIMGDGAVKAVCRAARPAKARK